MKCPKCKHENREGARFCLKCGAKLESICSKCGAKLPPGAIFCDECGAKVGESNSLSPQSAIPKLEDMQDKLYIPESLRQRMDTAKQELQGENRLVTALFGYIRLHSIV